MLLPGGKGHSLACVSDAANVTLREFAIEGTWQERGAVAVAAITTQEADNLSLVALDIRGWAGDAVTISGGEKVSISDCRVYRCSGAGFVLNDVEGILGETNSVIMGAAGFVLRGGSKARLFGNIAGLNQGVGYDVRSPRALLCGNNAHNNLQAGILVENAKGVVVAGNTCAANNQGCGPTGGIHLKGAVTGVRVLYNNCGDDQQIATQWPGIIEDATVQESEIRFNCTATLVKRTGKDPSLIANGKGSTVADNWTETLVPVGDALEAIKYYKDQNLKLDK